MAHIRYCEPRIVPAESAGKSRIDSLFSHRKVQELSHPDVERIWHTYDSQGHIMAWTFAQKSLKPFKLFPLCSDADEAGLGSTIYNIYIYIYVYIYIYITVEAGLGFRD